MDCALDDMVINLACAIRLYADDACLIEIVDSSPAVSAAKIHFDLQSLLNWSIKWLMIFNALKTLALTLTRKRKQLHHPHLTINGVILEEVNQHCHLGLVINQSLKGLAQAKIIKKSVILFRVLNMTI